MNHYLIQSNPEVQMAICFAVTSASSIFSTNNTNSAGTYVFSGTSIKGKQLIASAFACCFVVRQAMVDAHRQVSTLRVASPDPREERDGEMPELEILRDETRA